MQPASLPRSPETADLQGREGDISRLLLEWFSKNARDLPWRRNYDPYEVMVSEFMLQQTQVDTVLPYFERWMARFPDLRSLAAADEPDVEKLWEGLGYYSRARNLLKTAQMMAGEGYIQPPATAAELLRYPGFGPYTAGAVASIAANEPTPAVDGNVERVLSRLCDIAETAGSGALKRAAAAIVMRLMPPGEARAFNQALMELGALVCLPKNPKCGECPWEGSCLACERGVQIRRPLPAERPATEKIDAWMVLWRCGEEFLLRRRPAKGLWAGLWEIPWFARTGGTTSDIEEHARELNIECFSLRETGSIRFSFTNHRVTAWCVVCEAKDLSPLLQNGISMGEWGLFPRLDLASLTLPAPGRKFLALMDSMDSREEMYEASGARIIP